MNESDELLLLETSRKIMPLLETFLSLSTSDYNTLVNRKFRMDANHQTIVLQEKTISDNKGLIEDSKAQAKSIISMAEERSAEIERGIKERIAQVNHLEREAKRKVEEAERRIFDLNNKKAVKA